MPTFSQADRFMAVSTPLGADKFLLERLTGVEALSSLFEFELDLLGPADFDFTFSQILGQPLTVAFRLADESFRYINGIVCRFAEGDTTAGQGAALIRYHATVVPKLWLLTRRTGSRIFQQLSVPDILRRVLTGLDLSTQLQGKYEPRDYCSQYRESDFAFASRLMEEEGIYYYFTHADGAHTMVLGDVPAGHVDVPGPTSIAFDAMAGGYRNNEDRITRWLKSQEIRSGKQTLWDYTFELPDKHLEATAKIAETVQVGEVSHKLKLDVNESLELYDYPGGFAQRFDGIAPGGSPRAADLDKIYSDNARTTGVRMQQEAVQGVLITGESNARHLTAGHKFTLTDHPTGSGAYVLTQVEHVASLVGAFTSGQEEAIGYQNRLRCVPAALPFRPPQITPKARVHGTQTADVVGPAGEEIFTDKYGRVKVLFPWDREGKGDQDSSCWVRVASFWAGKQWGAIHIPRIGQEVVVAFEEGDPDKPIIVGSVYNAHQMPPYTLPDDRTKSGIKSRSTLEGTEENFNELRFEDKKGEEQVYFHAEKNFDRVVENNDTLKVGFREAKGKPEQGDQTIEIFNNQSLSVGKPHPDGKTFPADGSRTLAVWNNHTITVGAGKDKAADGSETLKVWKNQVVLIGTGEGECKDGSQTVTIYKDQSVTLSTGDATFTVEKGQRTTKIKKDETLTVQEGDRTVTLDKGNDILTLQKGNQTTKVSLGSINTEAMKMIELKVGQSCITIDQKGVTITGMTITIEGKTLAEMKSVMTKIEGSAMATFKGGVAMIN